MNHQNPVLWEPCPFCTIKNVYGTNGTDGDDRMNSATRQLFFFFFFTSLHSKHVVFGITGCPTFSAFSPESIAVHNMLNNVQTHRKIIHSIRIILTESLMNSQLLSYILIKNN